MKPETPGRAAAQHRDAFFTRQFLADCRTAIAPKIYAVLAMKIKICAPEN
jgi:hypothetical protein